MCLNTTVNLSVLCFCAQGLWIWSLLFELKLCVCVCQRKERKPPAAGTRRSAHTAGMFWFNEPRFTESSCETLRGGAAGKLMIT